MTEMKMIGLIGGMSWESTVTYYQVINETIRRELGGLHSACLLIHSIDFAPVAAAQEKDDWDACAKAMEDAAVSLEKGGADIILIGANTMHIAAEAVEKAVRIPLLHIAEATILRLHRDRIRRVALLGTKYTMCKDFYKQKLIDAGLEVMIPENDIDTVNDIIYDELCLGICRQESKAELLRIIRELQNSGAEGVILGCTELGLLVQQSDCEIPVYDTTLIHGEEAALFSIGRDS